jgi:hypothetical protein
MTLSGGGSTRALVPIIILAGATLGLLSIAIPTQPIVIRLGLALLATGTLWLISLRSLKWALLFTFAFLPLLALIRRLLIPLQGWTSYDVLLLIAPVLSILLIHRLFVLEKRPIVRDRFSMLVICLLGLAIFEVFNPQGGGLAAGATGLLFLAAPLLWFFVGRELADRETVKAVLVLTVAEGVAVAVYGLWQAGQGFPSWDIAWIRINGYGALSVALGTTRAFGTFSSAAEYAAYLAIAIIILLVGLLHRQLIALLILPLLGYALFTESSRGIFLLVLIAMVVILGLRTGSMKLTLVGAGLAVLGAWATVHFLGAQLTSAALGSGNPLIAHQVTGLLNPLDPQQSTYLTHQGEAVQGVLSSLNYPLGLGTGATNLAGQRLGVSGNTELDVSNAFVSLGILGGALFFVLVITTLWRVAKLGLRGDATGLAVLGILIVAFGQWLNGGYYAVSPLLWFLVGWASQEAVARVARRNRTSPARVPPQVAIGRQSWAAKW